MEYQEKTATLDIARWIGLSIRFPQQLLRIRLLSKARKPTGPTQQGQCYGEDHLLVFRPGTIYISKNIISLGRSVLNFFETTDWNILYECGSSVIFPGLDWYEWPSGTIFSFLKKGKSCTLRHCNSSSRPTTKLYLNKSIMNSIAMGREKKRPLHKAIPGTLLPCQPWSTTTNWPIWKFFWQNSCFLPNDFSDSTSFQSLAN